MAKGRRVNAQAMLYGAAQFMERFRTENHRYDQDLGGNALVLPDNLRESADGAYLLQATPLSASNTPCTQHPKPPRLATGAAPLP